VDPWKTIDQAAALIFYIESAGVTAFLTALFIHCRLDVSPAVLRLDSLIAAGLLGVAFLVTMAISHGGEE